MWRKWVLRGIGVAFGIVFALLISAYPDATRMYISNTFGVTDEQVVSFIIIGFITVGIVAFILVGIDFILDKTGYRFLVITRKKQSALEKTPTNELMKGVWFYKERDPKVLDQIFSEVKVKMIVVGSEFGMLGAREVDIAKTLKFADISFYVIDPDPESKVLDAAEASGIITRETRNSANTNIRKFCSLKKELTDGAERLQLYLYKDPPIHSVIVIDPDQDWAKIQVESYQYDTKEVKRRSSIIVSKALQPELFEKYYSSVRFVVSKYRIPYSCPKDTPVVSL